MLNFSLLSHTDKTDEYGRWCTYSYTLGSELPVFASHGGTPCCIRSFAKSRTEMRSVVCAFPDAFKLNVNAVEGDVSTVCGEI